jgi:hypothetical protein
MPRVGGAQGKSAIQATSSDKTDRRMSRRSSRGNATARTITIHEKKHDNQHRKSERRPTLLRSLVHRRFYQLYQL